VDTHEEEVKARIKAMFQQVAPAQRERVLELLKQYKTNESRLGFLRGWLKGGTHTKS